MNAWRVTTLFSLSLAIVELTQLAACQFPYAETILAGPTFELSTERPSASFAVTLCVDTDRRIRHVYPHTAVAGRAVSSTDRVVTLGGRVVEAESGHYAYTSHTTVSGTAVLDDFELLADGDIWEQRRGRLCDETQTVTFMAEDLQPGETLTVEWQVRFGAEYNDRTEPEEDDFSIDIVPL